MSSNNARNASSEVYQSHRYKYAHLTGSVDVEGFTVEHLISIFLGGNRNVQLRDDLLKDYVQFLKKFVTGELTQHQLKLFHAIKLSAIPKDAAWRLGTYP